MILRRRSTPRPLVGPRRHPGRLVLVLCGVLGALATVFGGLWLTDWLGEEGRPAAAAEGAPLVVGDADGDDPDPAAPSSSPASSSPAEETGRNRGNVDAGGRPTVIGNADGTAAADGADAAGEASVSLPYAARVPSSVSPEPAPPVDGLPLGGEEALSREREANAAADAAADAAGLPAASSTPAVPSVPGGTVPPASSSGADPDDPTVTDGIPGNETDTGESPPVAAAPPVVVPPAAPVVPPAPPVVVPPAPPAPPVVVAPPAPPVVVTPPAPPVVVPPAPPVVVPPRQGTIALVGAEPTTGTLYRYAVAVRTFAGTVTLSAGGDTLGTVTVDRDGNGRSGTFTADCANAPTVTASDGESTASVDPPGFCRDLVETKPDDPTPPVVVPPVVMPAELLLSFTPSTKPGRCNVVVTVTGGEAGLTVTATATLGALDPFTVELTRGSTPLGTQAQLGDLVTVTPADEDVSGASAAAEC